MYALRRSSRISRKERIRNVTIRQHIGIEETIIKEIEQNQHVIVDLNRSQYPLLSAAVLSSDTRLLPILLPYLIRTRIPVATKNHSCGRRLSESAVT
jgi:hypothetical protein